MNVNYNWTMADFDGMQEFLLNVDWYSVIYYNPSAVALWDAFIDVIRTQLTCLCPSVNVQHKPLLVSVSVNAAACVN